MAFRLGSRTASVVTTIVLAGGIADRAAVVAQQPPARVALLARASAVVAPRTPQLDPWERRSRMVALNAGALPNRVTAGADTGTAAAELVIDLFDGASITAVFDRFDPNDSGVTWVGHVPAQPGSRVTLVQGGGVLAASIVLPDASYTIRPAPVEAGDAPPAAGAPHVLVQINSDGFQKEAPPLVPTIAPQALEAAADAAMADTAEFIDVLMVYTSLAENWAGGPAGILNWINLGISETNSAYASSGVQQRVRLVYAERVAYTEVGAFSTNLNNLRAGAAGLNNVAALRNAYTADLVSMFVRPTSGADACGIAFIMTSVTTAFAPNGYSVVDAPCSSPNGTLAHEFGHNMGLRHDWYMDNGVTPFTYAHGYVNLAARFRTIMAYPDACTSQGFSCTRLLAFSNPEMTNQGQPLGVPGGTSTACPTGNALNMSCDADERRALNETAFTVANFREFSTLRPPLIQTHPKSQAIQRGQPLTLQVTVDGLAPFTYQWYRGAAPTTAQPIAGATGPSITFVPGADGVWFERWFYWVRVGNSIGTVNSLTATITMLQPGADPAAPQRRAAGPDSALTRRGSGSTAGSPAGPRRRLGTSDVAPAIPVVVIQPGTSAPPPVLWREDTDDSQSVCRAAALDAALAWTDLSRRAGDASTATAALVQLMRALMTIDDPVCRGEGGTHH